MTDKDHDLLGQYTREPSSLSGQDAFTALVNRHLSLVYSAAFRQLRSASLAEEVCQSAFIQLARSAGTLKPDTVVPAWLYRFTHNLAVNVVTREARRQAREQIACQMSTQQDSATDWTQIEPLLDEAMRSLDEADRAAILLRYFENKSLRDVGQAIGASEDAAQKRVTRALERLRIFFGKRKVAVGAGALAALISANASQAVPAGLAGTVATGVFTTSTAVSTSTALLMAKLKIGIVSTVIAASVVTPLVLHQQARARLREQDDSLRRQQAELLALQTENQRLAGLTQHPSNPTKQLEELRRLRGQAAALEQQTSTVARLREENRRLQSSAAKVSVSEAREGSIARMNFSKQCMVALLMYSADHQDQMPADFEQAKDYLPKLDQPETKVTTDQFEFVYQGARTAIKNPAQTLVLREKQARQMPDGKWAKAYAFADGHCEIHSEADDNFETWEKDHIQAPEAPNQ